MFLPHFRNGSWSRLFLLGGAFLLGGVAAGGQTDSATVAAVPLRPPSGPQGKTLFTTLPSEQTGVVALSRYDDPKMWRELYRELSLGAIGTGISIGDYDDDGRPDLYVVCKTGENRLFRNLGEFKFEDVTAKAGVAGPAYPWKQGCSFVDVNNDGRLDLYVCLLGAPNLLYINQGDGTFKEEGRARGVAVSDGSGHGTFCDYDRDGFLDLYLLTNVLDSEARPNGQKDRLFHNQGDGTFVEVTDRAGIFGETQGHSATWWDYNEDGWPDIYVANDFVEPDRLYRNNGNGTFTNVLSWVVPHTPNSSMGADQGDVNNDGHIDFLVADMAATSRYKEHRGMARVSAMLPETDSTPNAAPQYMRSALYLNTGTSHMLEAGFLTGLQATDWTWTVRLEDLDNDGWVDPLFTNGMVREFHFVDLLNRMSTRESMFEQWDMMRASPPLNEHNLVFRNRGDLHFENVSQAWGLDHFGVSFGSALGDLDGDGDLDFVFSNYDGHPTVCRNDGDAGQRILFELRGVSSNRFGIGAIVEIETAVGRQVRPMVIARGYSSSSEPVAHFGLGAETQVKRVTVRWPSGHVQTLEGLPAGRRYRLTEPSTKPPALAPPSETDAVAPGQFSDVTRDRNLALVTKERTVNEAARQPMISVRLNRQGPAAAVVDLENDGEEDLGLAGTMGEAGRFLSNIGDGHFLPHGSDVFTQGKQTSDGPLLFFDVDGDGDDDLLQTRGGNSRAAGDAAYKARLFLNDGSGRFAPGPADALPPLALSTGAAAAADFDRDGRLDVFLGARLLPNKYPTPPSSALLRNDGGKLVDVTDEIAPALRSPGLITSALWLDVDQDGWADLVLATDWGTVKYFHNDEGRGFTDRSEAAGFAQAGNGWWNSLAAADFNGDGRLDIAAGNLGLNTRYKASPEHPAVLYSGDLEGTGRVQLLEAQYEGDKLYPIRGLPQLSPVFPSVAKKFTTFEAYARATVDEVFPPERLAQAEKRTASEFQSGLFLSQSDGTYRFRPFPRLAQIAPIYGLLAGDFDGDGLADVVCVQNSYAPIPEITRFDGGMGWFLRGNGQGGVTPVPPSESTFIVTGDAKALVATDFNRDGWADFFVTRNNGSTLALENAGRPRHHSFAVVLRGPVGNPHGIGAIVQVMLQDGRTQTGVVTAGSGYLSQSTPALFFGFLDGQSPSQITVRWPDGRASTHSWQPDPKRLVLSPAP